MTYFYSLKVEEVIKSLNSSKNGLTKDDAEKVVKIAQGLKLNALIGGRVEAAEVREVVVKPLEITLSSEEFSLKK